MMNYFKKRSKLAKDHRAKQVLAALFQAPFEAKTVGEIGEKTGLGPVAYPLLASLQRQNLTELEWQQTGNNSQLSYRLTSEGVSYARSLSTTRKLEGLSSRGRQSVAKPLYSRLAYQISKRFGNL